MIVDDVYDLGYKAPFTVRVGETVFVRDDGSLSLSFVERSLPPVPRRFLHAKERVWLMLKGVFTFFFR